nr:MAG TPA: hypothetical protein [Caudoviricetes sp.]
MNFLCIKYITLRELCQQLFSFLLNFFIFIFRFMCYNIVEIRR